MADIDCECRIHLRAEEQLRKEGKTDFLKCRCSEKNCPHAKFTYYPPKDPANKV